MRIKKFFLFVSAFVMTGAALRAGAQEPFRAWVEHDTSGWIGDALNLKVSWECKDAESVRFPVLHEEFAPGLFILPQDSLQREFLQGNLPDTRIGSVTYRFSAYKEGAYTIPSFELEYAAGGKLYPARTDSGRVLLFAPIVDTTLGIKDIRGIFEVTKKELFKEYTARYGFILWILLGAAALAVGLWFLVRYIKRRNAGKPLFIPRKPSIPPVDRALASLKALKEKQLWQKGAVKEYYTELTDILRLYLKEALEIAAVEMTNDELCDALDDCARIEAPARGGLKEVLQRSTLVKFAKSEPAPDENETSFDKVEEFLKAMKQAADEASASEEGKAEAPVSDPGKSEAGKTEGAKSEAETSGKAE